MGTYRGSFAMAFWVLVLACGVAASFGLIPFFWDLSLWLKGAFAAGLVSVAIIVGFILDECRSVRKNKNATVNARFHLLITGLILRIAVIAAGGFTIFLYVIKKLPYQTSPTSLLTGDWLYYVGLGCQIIIGVALVFINIMYILKAGTRKPKINQHQSQD